MCGIVGFVDRREHDPAAAGLEVRRMLAMIRHRGPDQFGVYQDSSVALGSARLSIIDVDGGQQPISNEDGTLWIVFNGEIFNYVELRPELEKRGHRFQTATDTEVILHAYEEFGPDCFSRFNGQFAFAIWDTRRQELLLARDRMGIRPLFYAEVNGALVFGSEIKALLAYPGAKAEIDPSALGQIFTYWTPLPGRSAFRGIHQLPPGHFLIHSRGENVVKRYWSLNYRPDNEIESSEGEQVEKLGALLADATRIRLRSDVPVGAYLSGGLDSSIVARLIASESGAKLTTFSVTFDNPDFDESVFQLRMAEQLGTRHEIVHTTHADIANVFPSVIWHTEIPIMRTAPAPMFLLSQLAHDSGFKVVMTGEGADEVLGGYDIFKEAAIRRFWARNPASAMRPTLLKRLYADIPGMGSTNGSFLTAFYRGGLSETDSPYYSHLVRWRNNARTRRFFSADVAGAIASETPELPVEFETWEPLARAQYLEATLLLSEYLLSSQGDRMGMAHSVESRLPFLDYRVVEFCGGLSPSLKLRGLTEKYLLKKLGRRMLPDEVWRRPKRPYRAPIHKSLFCQPTPDYVRDLLSAGSIRSAGYFQPAAVAQLVAKASGGGPIGETDDMAVAGILSTQLVHHQFVTGFTPRPPIEADRRDLKVCGPCLAATT